MTDTLRSYGGPALLAALIHGLALAALLYHYTPTPDEVRRFSVQDAIQAQLVAADAATLNPAPATPPPPSSRREAAFEPVPKPPKPEERSDEIEPVEEPEPKAAPAPVDRRQLRELEQKALDEALDAEVAATDAAVGANEVASYLAKLKQLVSQNWSRPPSARPTHKVVLRIELVPTGEVVNVTVLQRSVDPAFDRSAVDAVHAARRFEVPTDRRLFERDFRVLNLAFTAKDLIR